jgi:hypothetical protein
MVDVLKLAWALLTDNFFCWSQKELLRRLGILEVPGLLAYPQVARIITVRSPTSIGRPAWVGVDTSKVVTSSPTTWWETHPLGSPGNLPFLSVLFLKGLESLFEWSQRGYVGGGPGIRRDTAVTCEVERVGNLILTSLRTNLINFT